MWFLFVTKSAADLSIDGMVISTPQGALLGTIEYAKKKVVYAFKGIPYAVPPVGDRRWKPAEPAHSWKGIKRATRFSPECIQRHHSEKGFFYRPNPQMSEDCLYINVWTLVAEPEERPQKINRNYPVMIWIHGGGLVEGAASIPFFVGAELARKGAVVVSLNYRLGIFGYFSHPALTE